MSLEPTAPELSFTPEDMREMTLQGLFSLSGLSGKIMVLEEEMKAAAKSGNSCYNLDFDKYGLSSQSYRCIEMIATWFHKQGFHASVEYQLQFIRIEW